MLCLKTQTRYNQRLWKPLPLKKCGSREEMIKNAIIDFEELIEDSALDASSEEMSIFLDSPEGNIISVIGGNEESIFGMVN